MQDAIATLLLAQERRLLDPAVRRDPDEVGRLLSDSFREFGASGRVWTKQQTLETLQREPPRAGSLREFEAVALAPTLYLVTYRSRRETETGEVREALRSSIWQMEEGAWRLIFHQGTPLA